MGIEIPKFQTEEPTTWGELVWMQLGPDGTAPLGSAKVTAVKSNTEEGKFYYLIDLSYIVVCTCDGFRFRSECSHARAYRGD